MNQNSEKENSTPTERRRSSRLAGNPPLTNGIVVASSDKLDKQPFPYVEYKGQIKYYTDGPEIAEVSDKLIQWLEKETQTEIVPMAFDMEWPFSFQTGPGKSSVIQICVEESCCYVFHLSKLTKLPAALVALLKHKKARLHGVNIKNDFRKLERDFPEVQANILIEKCVDLGIWCNEVCGTGGRWSLERLAKFLCKVSVDKNKKVRMSQWHKIPLDESQLMYAAIDVYIGQIIYREIEKRERLKQINEAKFLENNGEEAVKAVKALDSMHSCGLLTIANLIFLQRLKIKTSLKSKQF